MPGVFLREALRLTPRTVFFPWLSCGPGKHIENAVRNFGCLRRTLKSFPGWWSLVLAERVMYGRFARLPDSYLVDPASSHMLVSKIKPCMSKYILLHSETANGSLNQLWFLRSYNPTWITVVILELIHASKLRPGSRRGRAHLLDQNQPVTVFVFLRIGV